MSLEKAVEDLTKAVLNLVEQVSAVVEKAAGSGGDKPDKKDKADKSDKKDKKDKKDKSDDDDLGDDDDDKGDDDEITMEKAKELAKKKMAEGVSRKDIKELISDLGHDSIADLEGDDLETFYNKLKKMKA